MLTASLFLRRLSTHPGHDAVIVCLMFPLHAHRSSSGKRPSLLRFSSASAGIEVAGKHSHWLLSICKMRDGVILEMPGPRLRLKAQKMILSIGTPYISTHLVCHHPTYFILHIGEKWSFTSQSAPSQCLCMYSKSNANGGLSFQLSS